MPVSTLEYRLSIVMYVEGGTVVDYLWCYCCYILGRRAGLLSHAKPIQARLSGDSA